MLFILVAHNRCTKTHAVFKPSFLPLVISLLSYKASSGARASEKVVWWYIERKEGIPVIQRCVLASPQRSPCTRRLRSVEPSCRSFVCSFMVVCRLLTMRRSAARTLPIQHPLGRGPLTAAAGTRPRSWPGTPCRRQRPQCP